MAFADSNRVGIRILEETVWGTTPASGDSRELRLTSSSFAPTKDTVVSDEIRADRMVSALTEVAAAAGGDINYEYSSGSHDELLAAFLMGSWSRPMTMDFWKGTLITVSATNVIKVLGLDISTASGYLFAGRRIKTEGMTNAVNNGYWEITSAVVNGSDTDITITTSTLIIEGGNPSGKLFDANDVIVRANTNIRAGTTGNSSFDSNGTNAFAAAITAGQLVSGQKIYVEGLGYPIGTITLSGAAAAADRVDVNDGVNTAVSIIGGTNWTVGVTAAADGDELALSINAATPLNVIATSDGAGVVTVRNLGGSQTTDAITDVVDGGAVITVVSFAVGVDGNHGVFTITSVTNDVINVTPAPTTDANTEAFGVTVKGSSVVNPSDVATINQRSFSVETSFNDIGQHLMMTGMVPGTFTYEISAGAIVTGTVGFQGRGSSMAQISVLGLAPYNPLATTPGEVVNATADIGDLIKDGVALPFCIQSLSLTGEANLRTQSCVGSKFAQGIGQGRFNLTGSMNVFFEDESLYTDFLNHVTVSLGFTITDNDEIKYVFTVPAMKLSQDTIAPGGIDQDVFENIEFTALRDPTTGVQFQIDRFSSVIAVGG